MSGAIPIAIFDTMLAQFEDPIVGSDFFNMVVEYDQVPACRKITDHVEQKLMTAYPRHWHAQACHVQAPLISMSVSAPEFPSAFRQSLARLKEVRDNTRSTEFDSWVQSWLRKLSNTSELDEGIRKVAESVIASLGNP
jgi:U3 small nucleolar RNA-associated protein 6